MIAPDVPPVWDAASIEDVWADRIAAWWDEMLDRCLDIGHPLP